MKHIARLWENMLARRTLSMVLCLALAVTSAGVCVASTNSLIQETRAAGEEAGGAETGWEAARADTQEPAKTLPEPVDLEGETLEESGGQEGEVQEDTRCLHEFTGLWVGYECKLTDYVGGYEPGDEVRISVSFNKAVTSQIGLYIDGVWNSFRGEGKKRNITLVPDSDYLNIQISDLKGQPNVNLTDISVEIVRKGEADTGSYLHKFTGLWQGYETKFSDFNPDYEPGDQVRVTVNYNKFVSSQLGMNLDGGWSTLAGDGKAISKDVTPDNDYLNIQITDMWANYKVGVVSVSVDILKKGPGVPHGGGGGRLAATRYTEPGDYVLFSGQANEKYEADDGWILDCADTDWITLKYSCVAGHENWGILSWGATVDGEWVDGPGYSADSLDPTRETTQIFSIKYLRRMMKITPESNVGYLNLNAYSDGRIEELTLHVGSGIPREESLFKDGAPNQPWICTDIERILDAPDEQYLCVQYTCTSPELEGWTVLSWGASVDGEWRNGKSYKASYREATRVHTFSMRMDAFRNMLHLSWDAKVDSIQLSAYNEARILDIWFSDEKVEDAGDSKKDKLVREGGYSSPNRGTYDSTTKMEGIEFPQKVELGPWQWGDLEGWDKIVRELKEGVYLIIEYSTEDGTEPNLQFTMSDGKQQGVTPTYVTGGQAVFSYQDIQGFLPDYLIPQEIGNMQVSSGDGAMSVGMVKVVQDNTKLEEEPIAVLTNSWSGYSTQISKWHSDYQVGDTVKVTAKFDKRMPVAIAFNIGGIWDCGNYAQTNVASRTAKPTDDYLGIQLGEMPKSKRFLKIMDIQVEIVGKKNFNECVEVKGSRSAGILASTKKEAATAVLSTEEINQGTKVLFNIEKGALSQAEKEKIAGLFAGVAAPQVAMVSDITVYKKSAGKEAPVTKTSDPVSFKVPLSNELLGKGYDFAVVRFHSGEADFLEDLDGNEATVTFASDKFSKFAIVYGEEGAFDGQSGAIKVFRGAWEGWQTSFSQYNSKFKPGKATKVTLTFDSEVKAYVDYNGPDWTRVEGQGTGKTYMATVTPSDDSLTVGLGDLNGNSKVKLLNVKVEQEAEKITSFTGVNQKFKTSFSAFYEKFVTGRPVTVKLTFDKDVVGCVSYHKGGTLEEIVDSGSEAGKVLVKTFTPGNDRWNIWIANMNGNETVDLADIEVSQAPVPPIHTFTHSWGGGEDTYSKELSALCKEYEVGDTVKVTAVFDKSSQVKIMVGQGGGNNEITATGARVSLTATPGADRFRIQAGDDGKLPLGLLDVTVEVVKKGDPVEGIHRFMETYAGFETAMSQYNAKFQAGKETMVTLVFDKEVEAQVAFKTESSGWDVRSGSGKEIAVTATPKEDYLNIQIKDMKGNPAVNLLEVKVEQKTPEVTPIFTFTGAWGSDNSTFEAKFSDYMEGGAPFQAGVETTVKLTFDQPVGVKVQGNNMDSEETGGGDKVAQVVVTPSEDKFSVQVKEVPNGKVNLLAVEVEQKTPEVTPIFTFTGAWGSDNSTFEAKFSDYMEGGAPFQAGVETTVKLTLDQPVGVKVQGNNMDSEETGGGDKVAQVVVTPSEDKFSVQVKEVPNGKVNLLAVEVSQPGGDMASKFILEEEPVYVFTDPETAVLELADYSDSYEEGQGVAVELNLFSDGMFRVLVEESEMTAEEAKAAKANPAARKRLSIEASPSDAAPLNLATPSNAVEKDEVPVYESDADGVLSIKWEGKPGSGAIAVTILEMDGTQVNIDTMEVEEKDVVKAVKDTLASTAKKIAQLVLPDGGAEPEEKMPSLEQEPAKKEEEPAVNLEEGGKPDGFGEGPEKGSKEKEEKPEEDRPEPDMFLEEEARFLDEEGFRGEEEGD